MDALDRSVITKAILIFSGLFFFIETTKRQHKKCIMLKRRKCNAVWQKRTINGDVATFLSLSSSLFWFGCRCVCRLNLNSFSLLLFMLVRCVALSFSPLSFRRNIERTERFHKMTNHSIERCKLMISIGCSVRFFSVCQGGQRGRATPFVRLSTRFNDRC